MINIFSKIIDDTRYLSEKKIRNPFFLTYFFIVIYRNWEVVFVLFNFDKELKLDDKLNKINLYFKDVVLWEELLFNLLITLIVLVTSYILIFFFRALANFFERKVFPIADKIDYSLTVPKQDFVKQRNLKEKYYEEATELRNQKIDLDEKYSKLLKENNENKITLESVLEKNQQINEHKDKFELESSLKINELQNTNEKLISSLSGIILGTYENMMNEEKVLNLFKKFSSKGFSEIPKDLLHVYGSFNLIDFDGKSFNIIGIVLKALINEIEFNDFNDFELRKKIMDITKEKIKNIKFIAQ